MPLNNLFADLPVSLSDEMVHVLLNKPHLRIERIVSRGHASPEGFWYDQDQSEFVVLLAGAARLRFEDDPEGEAIELEPGSCLDIPAHRRHRVEWTDPDQFNIWLAIHYEAS